jgi:hypothetical protein
MRTTERRRERLIIGAGGVLLIASLFLPWADSGGARRSGWELLTMADVYLLITGTVAIWAAISGGRFGLFRPDLSLNGATDLLGIMATLVLTWLIAFDFPHGADREVGVFVALAAAVAVMGGAGDYGTLRGAAWFPPTVAGDYSSSTARADLTEHPEAGG